MPIPDRPVSGALIEAEWGQEVHDRVFAPKATLVHGGSSTVLTSSSSAPLNLDVADDDPGGWLNAVNDRIIVPSGADGLYSWFARCNSSVGIDGQSVRIYLLVNGATFTTFQANCDTGSTISINGTCHAQLSAGDILTMACTRFGTGANPHVQVTHCSLIRHGDERGA